MKSRCIDFDTLVNYIAGTLSGEDKDLILEHLSKCDICLQKFTSAASIMNDRELDKWDPMSEEDAQILLSDLNPVRRFAKKLHKQTKNFFPIQKIKDFFYPDLPLQLDGVRSKGTASEDFDSLSKKIGVLQAELSVEKERGNKADIRVKVFRGSEKADNISLTLVRDGRNIQACFLRDGYADFDNLSLGRYHLLLEQNSLEKKNLIFEIRKSGIYNNDENGTIS